MQNVKLTLALPTVNPQTGQCNTVEVIVAHSNLVLAVTDNGRAQEYVPANFVQHVITYKFSGPSGSLTTHTSKVLSTQPTDESVSDTVDPNVQLSTIQAYCICIAKSTDVNSIALVSLGI